MPTWIINLATDIVFWIGIPALFVISVSAPFLFIKKKLKRPFTAMNIGISILVAAALVALDLYILYWAFAALQGIAACSLYGC